MSKADKHNFKLNIINHPKQERERIFRMVHTFTALGQYLVADVNSGAVHVLDPMNYDLLSRVEGEEKLGEHCPAAGAAKFLSENKTAPGPTRWSEGGVIQNISTNPLKPGGGSCGTRP